MTDYLRTVMRQYDSSAALGSLLADFDQWVDPAKLTADFLLQVWDISTATGFGLDIWGRILGQSRYLQIQQTPDDNFGFDIGATPGTNWKPWNQAPFFNGATSGLVSFALQDEAYRQLLRVKAAANIASCNIPALNALLRSMFGVRGRTFVTFNPATPMHLSYNFDFFPSPIERAIIESGLFPQPAGVLVSFVFKTFDYAPWGFAGMNAGANPEYVSGFNQGPFYNP